MDRSSWSRTGVAAPLLCPTISPHFYQSVSICYTDMSVLFGNAGEGHSMESWAQTLSLCMDQELLNFN
jgi:hypothetical protein